MRNSDRLRPRPVFLNARRRAKVYFHTSSIAKYAQASLVFARLGLPLSGTQPDYANRIEDYQGGVEQLVNQKVRDAWLGQHTVYFVEDTYVRIEALSQPTKAKLYSAEWAQSTVPGLRTHEWFKTTNFQDLDSRLVVSGGDRRATVYSTLALHLPGTSTPRIFTGRVKGSIADRPGTGLAENEPFPWLSPTSFNGWFIPAGESTPLSDLDLERSLDSDFRVDALLQLVDRLEEYVAILNLPPVSVELVPDSSPGLQQPQLFPTRRTPIVVIGSNCAGKTTIGQFVAKSGYVHIEASSVLQTLQGTDIDLYSRNGYLQAMTTLALQGWDVIARSIINQYAPSIETGLCITGLRTVEEIGYLVHILQDVLIVLLEAPTETRFERYLLRHGESGIPSLTRFRERDREHASFGLIDVADHFATLRLSNNSTLDDLETLAKDLAEYGSTISGPTVSHRGVGIDAALKSQIHRCLKVLAAADKALSPAQIEILQTEANNEHVVKRNAVRKALVQYPVLVRRISKKGMATSYELTEHGHAYVSAVEAIHSAHRYSVAEPHFQSEAFSHIRSK